MIDLKNAIKNKNYINSLCSLPALLNIRYRNKLYIDMHLMFKDKLKTIDN